MDSERLEKLSSSVQTKINRLGNDGPDQKWINVSETGLSFEIMLGSLSPWSKYHVLGMYDLPCGSTYTGD